MVLALRLRGFGALNVDARRWPGVVCCWFYCIGRVKWVVEFGGLWGCRGERFAPRMPTLGAKSAPKMGHPDYRDIAMQMRNEVWCGVVQRSEYSVCEVREVCL